MAIPPVTIEFLARGVPNIAAAVRNVTTTLARAEQEATRGAARGAVSRQREVDNEAKMKVRAWAKTDRDVRRIQDRAIRDTERAAKSQERIVEQSERAKLRSVERSAAAMDRIRDRSAAMAGRAAVREVDRRDRERQTAGSNRAAMANSFFGAAAGGVAAGARRVGSMATQTAGIAAQLGGGFSIADSVMSQSKLRAQAAVLSASTEMAGPDKRKIGADEIYSKAKAIGARQGIDPAEVLKGFDEIKKLSGDLDQAMRVMPGVARLATATGGNVGEMSGLAANIIAANPNIKDDALEKQMRVFTRQGVVGGVEVADFAKYGSRLTAGAANFGGDSSKNLATMGAMAQISRQYGGAASPAEAALAAQRFGTDVAKHSKSLKAAGIDVSDHQGNLKDAQSILMEMISKTGGDVTKLGAMGLGERGVKALTGASAIYKNAGGGQAGKDAVAAEFAKYTTGVTEKEVSSAEKTVLGAPDKQLFAVMQQLRTSIGEELLPEFLKLVPVIQQSTPAFVNLLKNGVPAFIELIKAVSDFAEANKGLISDLAAHPIGTLIGFEISKSFAAAALPALLKSLMSAAFSGGGGAPGLGGAAGGAGAGAMGGVMAGAALQGAAYYDLYNSTSGAMAEGKAGGTAARNAMMNGTAAERAQAETDLATAKQQSSGGATEAGWVDRLTKGVSYLTGPLGIASSYAGDAASSALGFKSSGERATEAIKASEFVDAAEVSRVTTEAIANGVREGARQGAGSSGPNGAGRSEPIINR